MRPDPLILIRERFPVKRLDAGEYASFKASPLHVLLDWYWIDGIGNLSILRGKAMAGLMRMDTIVINPTLRDLPLFSFDGITALGKHTMLIEYYDTLRCHDAFDVSALESIKSELTDVPDHDLGQHWYDSMKLPVSISKKCGSSQFQRLQGAFERSLTAYLDAAKELPLLSDEQQAEKQVKATAYVDGLLQQGGPSTDAFVHAIGRDRTEDLFRRIVFGTNKA